MKGYKQIFLSILFPFIVLAAFNSCRTQNKFACSFGKRKYTKGFYDNLFLSKKIRKFTSGNIIAVRGKVFINPSAYSKVNFNIIKNGLGCHNLIHSGRKKYDVITSYKIKNPHKLESNYIMPNNKSYFELAKFPINALVDALYNDDKKDTFPFGSIGFVLAIVSVLLTILSVVLLLSFFLVSGTGLIILTISILNIVCAIAALILCCISITSKDQYQELAIAGLIISIVGILGLLILLKMGFI